MTNKYKKECCFLTISEKEVLFKGFYLLITLERDFERIYARKYELLIFKKEIYQQLCGYHVDNIL